MQQGDLHRCGDLLNVSLFQIHDPRIGIPVIPDRLLSALQCSCCMHPLQVISPASEYCSHCGTLQHTAAHYDTLRHCSTHCDTLRHCSTNFDTARHTATHYDNVRTLRQCSTRYDTVRHTEVPSMPVTLKCLFGTLKCQAYQACHIS